MWHGRGGESMAGNWGGRGWTGRKRSGGSWSGGSWGRGDRRRRRRRLLLPAVLLALFWLLLEHTLSPLLMTAAQEQARTQALYALTEAASRQIAAHGEPEYQQMVAVERDDSGRVTLLTPNTALFNTLINDVTLDAVASLEQLSHQSLSLPLGAVTGSALLSGLGPDVSFRLRMLGTPRVKVEDEFSEAGINQVRHRIWLELSAEVRVLAPFSRDTTTATATVLLAESVIVGYTPDTYVTLGQ